MLSPRLKWLVNSLSKAAQSCVQQCGITSVIDPNAWDSEAQFLDACAGEHANEPVLSELRSLWAAAQGSCAAAVRRAVSTFAEHEAHEPASVDHRPAPSQLLAGGRCDKKSDVGAAKRRRLRAAEPEEACLHMSSLQLREKAAVESACSDLWKLFLEVGESGSQRGEYVSLSPTDQDKFAAMFLDNMCLVAVTTLQSALRVVRRWKRHCCDSNISLWKPSSVHVALWLRSLREHGPTAPQGAYNTLKWLEKKLGMCFH